MSIADALVLMIGFGTFVISLIGLMIAIVKLSTKK
ncbi:putative holin-like toxin [Staphylococcus sp. IVB6246]|nr:putative holin-like toxin [Staphylococcus sp. IVB6246]UXR72638.1 putative holin-like toxin [Staphylococcus sp. IVB6240]UXR74944.1 putative holin-like toxin [Staphylococcus sp. IVB6238]UXR77263.1 putative holin-like toxin [Staphylococcus sp. IVB6233]UXR81426.1 putative holin-like toxin [Staphylococcus sp. IVB6218]